MITDEFAEKPSDFAWAIAEGTPKRRNVYFFVNATPLTVNTVAPPRDPSCLSRFLDGNLLETIPANSFNGMGDLYQL